MVAPKFAGVKMIPPGVHFFSYQYLPSSGHMPPAVGMFKTLGPRQVVVQRWDPVLEGLAPLTDEEEVRKGGCH
jgi:A1 cistron-splicing factor AAR2